MDWLIAALLANRNPFPDPLTQSHPTLPRAAAPALRGVPSPYPSQGAKR